MNINDMSTVLSSMKKKSYWKKENTIEFFAFMTKVIIIVPGLILGRQWWWLYLVALISSLALIWTSTVKTLPTIIIFNVIWVALASFAVLNHFFGIIGTNV